MQPHFHVLDSTVFCARMGTGAAPTEAERNKFKSPKLKKGMLARDLYSEFVCGYRFQHLSSDS